MSNFRRILGACKYCGGKALYQFKNGVICCEKYTCKCPAIRKKNKKGNKGRIRSKEHCKKLSRALKNRIFSKEHCENISKAKKGENNPMFGLYGKDHPTYGRKHTDEWIAWSTKKLLALADKHWMKTPEKRKWLSENNPMHKPEIVALFMGKNNPTFGGHTAETILKMSGENHPNWKGGISHEPYCKEWDFDEFKKLIRDRDNNQCQNPDCWKTFNPKYKLSVHHINGDKKNCDPWNLISLCNSCNVRAEGNKKISRLWWQKLYQNIMAEKYGYKYD